jgi:hypothetical protein
MLNGFHQSIMASTLEDDFLFILVLSTTYLPKIKGSNQDDSQ